MKTGIWCLPLDSTWKGDIAAKAGAGIVLTVIKLPTCESCRNATVNETLLTASHDIRLCEAFLLRILF